MINRYCLMGIVSVFITIVVQCECVMPLKCTTMQLEGCYAFDDNADWRERKELTGET